MSDLAIKVEELGKLYKLGEIGTGTISHDLNRWMARIRGKEDPYAKIGEANDRTVKGNNDYVWGLKDINFEIKKGDACGIIGRNGAGKSTLLKILSKVTSPTRGNVKVKGRIASLLEVGTGFHPELTGRENVFLNGAILGMRRNEIKRKFDEIVDFSGVNRYIDTPVKRYSSGMYVRLAFAVAANLESDILIVDEVLAVGDSDFQKRCLGKMDSVSKGEGKTVLFVSHNLGSIAQLCNKGIFLKNGQLKKAGDINSILNEYVSENDNEGFFLNTVQKSTTHFKSIKFIKSSGEENNTFLFSENLKLQFAIENVEVIPNLFLSIIVKDQYETPLFSSHFEVSDASFKEGVFLIEADLGKELLLPSNYKIEPLLHVPNKYIVDKISDHLSFSIEDDGNEYSIYSNNPNLGKIAIPVNWNYSVCQI